VPEDQNPYRWDTHQPALEVPATALIEAAVALLTRGGGGYLLGGRGMGKSVLLHQLHQELSRREGTRVLLIETLPMERTPEAVLASIARQVGVSADAPLEMREILDAAQVAGVQQLVLLFDELDQYAAEGELGRVLFNNLEGCRKSRSGRLGIFVAGGLGTLVLRDLLGSDFLSRARKFLMAPFTAGELRALAAPYSQRGAALSDEVLEAVMLASGGNPALVTFALQALWEHPSPSPRAVAEAFLDFQEHHGEFLRSFQRAVLRSGLSDTPQRALEVVRAHPGRVPMHVLQAAVADQQGALLVDQKDALNLLAAAGLIRIKGSLQSDPLCAWPVASILNLPGEASQGETLRARLVGDLQSILGRIHALAPDFFRPGRQRGEKQLVPEASFSAFLVLGLEGLGWQVEREAIHGAGRTDLKARHPVFPGAVAVVEVKIWPRNDYAAIHEQVVGYWSAGVEAGAAVVIADKPPKGWPGVYEQVCLQGRAVSWTRQPVVSSLTGHFEAIGQAGGAERRVDHLLFHLPRGD